MNLEEIQKQKLADLATSVDRLAQAEQIYEEKKAETKDAKEDYEACRDQVAAIAKDLRDIERGTFQQELPFEGPGRASLELQFGDEPPIQLTTDQLEEASRKVTRGKK